MGNLTDKEKLQRAFKVLLAKIEANTVDIHILKADCTRNENRLRELQTILGTLEKISMN